MAKRMHGVTIGSGEQGHRLTIRYAEGEEDHVIEHLVEIGKRKDMPFDGFDVSTAALHVMMNAGVGKDRAIEIMDRTERRVNDESADTTGEK